MDGDGGDGLVQVLLKPLDAPPAGDASSTASHRLLVLNNKQQDSNLGSDLSRVVADSWIVPKPIMESSNDSGGDVNGDDRVGSSYFGSGVSPSSEWDCDGCPPPYFDLPPPPRPPFMEDADTCSVSPYDTCDSPIIIDSQLHLKNDLLNILLIVICAALLVAVAIVVAVVIWRKVKRVCLRKGLSRGLAGKSSPSTSPRVMNARDQFGSPAAMTLPPPQSGLGPATSKFQPPSFATATAQFFRSGGGADDVGDRSMIELSEHPNDGSGRHVYTNPNYPTLEIGGMPFYLMPAGPAAASSPSSVHPKAASSEQSTAFYEPGSSVGSGGPIYEDIDRMCTYRGPPPPPPPAPQPQHSVVASPRRSRTVPQSERTYCNVPPVGEKSGDSGESSGSPPPPSSSAVVSSQNFCGTSSSEVSFESGSSPRHQPTQQQHQQQHPNILVNPLVSPARFASRSPQSANLSPARLSSSTRSPSSVYYYSDTLRPKQREQFDSDSGFSNNTRSCSEDTPPPPPLQQLPSRMASTRSSGGGGGKRKKQQPASPLSSVNL